MKTVYIALGGNLGDPKATFAKALSAISKIDGVFCLECSRFHQTAPVSDIPQSDYCNAVCRFQTTLAPKKLFVELQQIERDLGKIPKPKNHPRIIDLDILFYGSESYVDDELEIPHPRWKGRLFVLVPLRELVEVITVPDNTSATGFTEIRIDYLINKSNTI